MIRKIDDFLIERFEGFCHFTQKAVGLTSVFWGRTCIVYTAAKFSFDTAFPSEADPTPWRWVFFGFVCFIYLCVYIELGDKRPKIGSVVTANVHKYSWEFTRILMLILSPMDIWICLKNKELTFGITYTLALYFLAVDDLPSQPSKLRLWLESLVSGPQPHGASTRNQ